MNFVLNKELPLEVVGVDSTMMLLDIKPFNLYMDGKKSEQIGGYVYSVVEMFGFERLDIRVTQQVPLMEPETLKSKRLAGEKFYVEFTKATVKAYFNYDTKTVRETFRAVDVSLVDEEIDL